MDIIQTLKTIGNGYTSLISGILSSIPQNLLTNPTTAKIISLLIPAIILFLVIKVITLTKPVIKWIVIILSALLFISVLTTFMI